MGSVALVQKAGVANATVQLRLDESQVGSRRSNVKQNPLFMYVRVCAPRRLLLLARSNTQELS